MGTKPTKHVNKTLFHVDEESRVGLSSSLEAVIFVNSGLEVQKLKFESNKFSNSRRRHENSASNF